MHDISKKIESYEVVGEFVTNVDIDKNGRDFLKACKNIVFMGKSHLVAEFISGDREPVKAGTAKFDVLGFGVAEYVVSTRTKAVVAPVKASELAKLDGISDQSLFAHNVRGPLGRTGVNKDIAESIRSATKHKLFPLFYNGITVICRNISADDKSIVVKDYHVVNGCQSISALYHNSAHITGDLRILAKVYSDGPGLRRSSDDNELFK